MPVPRVWVGKGTDYSTSSQTRCDQRVIVNVDVVIEVDKIMPNCLAKDQPRDCAQKRGKPKRLASETVSARDPLKKNRAAGERLWICSTDRQFYDDG